MKRLCFKCMFSLTTTLIAVYIQGIRYGAIFPVYFSNSVLHSGLKLPSRRLYFRCSSIIVRLDASLHSWLQVFRNHSELISRFSLLMRSVFPGRIQFCCYRCQQTISGDEYVMRVGKDSYHVNCFLCDYCNQPLQVRQYCRVTCHIPLHTLLLWNSATWIKQTLNATVWICNSASVRCNVGEP